MGNVCKVAIIGAGAMAREHVRAFLDVPGCEVCGIFSRTKAKSESLASEFGIQTVSDNVEALFHTTEANLLVVAVSELSAREILLSAFSFPWVILAEKPVGLNYAENKEITKAASGKQAKVFVGLNRRLYGSTLAAVNDIGKEGGPRFIEVFDQQDPDVILRAGRDPTVVKNWMYANSLHLIDYFTVFGRGKVNRVVPISSWNPEKPGIVVAAVFFESGDIGMYHGVWNGPGPWACFVTTPKRRWEMRPLERAAYQVRGQREFTVLPEAEFDLRFKPGFRVQAEQAVKAAFGLPSSLATLEEANKSMLLVRNIFELSQ